MTGSETYLTFNLSAPYNNSKTFNPLIPLTMFNLQDEIKKIKAEKRQAQANGIILGLAIIGISISYSALLIMFLDL
jgi:hypothetical protein